MRSRPNRRPGGPLRRDAPALLLYVVATLVMTHPLVPRMGTGWVGSRGDDTYMKLWDQWWLGRVFESGGSLGYTRDLFHPIGVDLTFHSTSWTVAALARALAPLAGEIDAYNLTILLALFASAYGAYLMILDVLRSRTSACLGGLVYGFAPYHVAHTGGHPDLVHLAPVPLAALFLGRALRIGKLRAALAAALWLGVAAFTSLYIMVLALLTLAPVFLHGLLSGGRWRDPRARRAALAFVGAGAVLVGLRTVPVLGSPEKLSAAIERKYDAARKQTDLLAFVVPSHFNPLFAPHVEHVAVRFVMNRKWPAYLGMIPLMLTLVALVSRRRRVRGLAWLWLVIGVQFLLLSLGSVLRLNGRLYPDVPLPGALLAGFPPIRAIGRPDYFVLGLLLPLSVCTAAGFEALRSAFQTNRARLALAGLAMTLLLFEYWNGPYAGESTEVSSIYRRLAAEPGRFAVIDLPMGRQPSKRYVYQQTIHGRPIAEGLTARTPSAAYDYIARNPLLARWRVKATLRCDPPSSAALRAGIEALIADGFRYVLVHHRRGALRPRPFASYFEAPPAFEDAEVSVFRLEDMRRQPPCGSGENSPST